MSLQGAPELPTLCHQAPSAHSHFRAPRQAGQRQPSLAERQRTSAATASPPEPHEPELQLRTPAAQLVLRSAAGTDNQQTIADEFGERHVLHGRLWRLPERSADTVMR